MTIEESNPTPQEGGESEDDLKTLVRMLADQAKAADHRCAELAERVALLEGKRDTPSAPEGPALQPNSRLRPTRVSFAQNNGGSSRNISTQRKEVSIRNVATPSNWRADSSQMNAVVGVHNDDPEEALAHRVLFLERQWENQEEEKNMILNETDYSLPESTFSLLITHHPSSVPFGFAVFTIALSIACLSLTLASSISNGTPTNKLGIPAGVDGTVRAAQFIGAIVGVLMEDEIPQGLQLIANGAGYTLLLNGEKPVQKRVIVSSIFRLVVGYLFLSSLLINIAQNSDVIQIFYDLLALEFVENIDDISFALAKRGFFGRVMLIATNEKHNLEISGPRERRGPAMSGAADPMAERRLSFSGLIVSNNRVNQLVRFVYFLNATMLLVGLAIIAGLQKNGRYRSNRINVLFDEEIWEHAHVRLPDDSIEDRLLIYSHFNGIYEEEGSHNGYPRYIEQNKYDSSQFGSSVRGAEIIFCNEIGSWVFMHPDIFTSPDGEDENECSWLWRSHQTENYDLVSTTDGAWEAWVGEVKPLAFVSITSAECLENSDCNYHGLCGEDKKCYCVEPHFGDSCEFELPCQSLATEKAHTIDPAKGVYHWKQDNPIRVTEHRVYNRPLYVQSGLSGEPFDMRLYKLLEKGISSSPSNQPSTFPSVLSNPTYGIYSDSETPKASPIPVHSQNEYDSAPDFADWDDFFESPALHPGLEELLDDFQVVISYSGSRFYGTITESNADLDDLYSPDYHAFWSQSFDVHRTFIISDITLTSSPVGIDFFEMRRRVNSVLNPNVHFAYGPYGALIPLMNYQGTGFFQCLDETPQPSTSPSFSRIPSKSPSSSGAPSSHPSISPTGCFFTDVNIEYDENPNETSWTISEIVNSGGEMSWETILVKRSEDYATINATSQVSMSQSSVCLPVGDYVFTIEDSAGNGFSSKGGYSLKSDEEVIACGGKFDFSDSTKFSIPFLKQYSNWPRPAQSPVLHFRPSN